MEELNINLLFGIEIFIKYLSLFEQILDKGLVKKINCSLSKEAVISFRDTFGEEFYNSYYPLMKFIFRDDRINIVDNQNFECLGVFELAAKYGINIEYKLRNEYIENMELELPNNYITITTKSMNSIPIGIWKKISTDVIDLLNSSGCKIILLGERTIKHCKEYEIHNAYSIYPELISGLNDYIDMTIEDATSNNDLEPLKKTFFILNKSKLNIYISDAGIKTIAISCSENVLGLGMTIYNKDSFKHNNLENINQTSNVIHFMRYLYNNILKIKNDICSLTQ